MKNKVAAGQIVCEGIFWSRVDHSNDWYEPQENLPWKRPKRRLVMLTYIAGIVPPPATRISSHNRKNPTRLIQLGADEIDYLQKEQMQREGFELTVIDKIEKKKKHTSKNNFRNSVPEGENQLDEDAEYIDDTWEHPDY